MRVPGFLLGCVTVPVPKVNIYLGLAGVVLAYAGMLSGQWLVLSIGIGIVSVMPIGVGFQWLAQRKLDREIKDWPVSVQVMPGADGERVAFVTAQDGTVSSLVIPDDYDPDDDNGLWLIRQVAPDLADRLFGSDE